MEKKNYFAKIFAVFVFAMFVIGMVPIALADDSTATGTNDSQNSGSGLGLGVNANEVAGISDATVETAVTTEVSADSTTEVQTESAFQDRVNICVAHVMNNHSNFNKDRVEKFCRNHLAVRIKILNKMKENMKENKEDMKENKEKIKEIKQDFNEKIHDKKEEIKMLGFEKRDKLIQLRENFIAKLNEKEVNIYAHLDAKTKQWCMNNSDDCRNRIGQWKLEKIKEMREIAQDKLENARQKYNEAKEKFENREKEYNTEKQAFLDLKLKLNECKSNNQIQECITLEQQAEDHAKKMVSNSIEMLTNHLQKIKETVGQSKELSQEEATSITAEIDAEVKVIADLKVKLDAAKTKEEIKAVAKQVQETWKRYKYRAQLHALTVANARVKGIVAKNERVDGTFQCAVDALAAGGKDVSQIDVTIAKYNEQLANARDHYDKARVEFKAAIDLRITGDLTDAEIQTVITHNQEGRRHLEAAQASLKQAQDLFKEVVRMIKEAGGNVESCKAKFEKESKNDDLEVVAENNTPIEQTVSIDASASASS